jgi:hypothetical protein
MVLKRRLDILYNITAFSVQVIVVMSLRDEERDLSSHQANSS